MQPDGLQPEATSDHLNGRPHKAALKEAGAILPIPKEGNAFFREGSLLAEMFANGEQLLANFSGHSPSPISLGFSPSHACKRSSKRAPLSASAAA